MHKSVHTHTHTHNIFRKKVFIQVLIEISQHVHEVH